MKTIDIRTTDGRVWLTFSEEEDRGVLVHGVFTTKRFAEKCANEIRKRCKDRAISVGEWTINRASIS